MNSKFIPHQLNDDQKLNRTTIVTGDETWRFQETKCQPAECRLSDEGNPKQFRLIKSKIKTMLITFYDSKRIIHKKFVARGSTITAEYYLDVLKRLLNRIPLEHRKDGN